MAWLKDAIAENRVPTTQEMDEVDPNDPDAYTVMIQCYEGHWNRWPNYESGQDKRVNCQAEGCTSRLYQSNTICSLRSWDPKRKKARRRDS